MSGKEFRDAAIPRSVLTTDEAEPAQLAAFARQSIIRHLPFFAAVAEDEHFQRAAQRLNMTQSALSRRVQDLEEELGVLLFDRRQRGARLTAAGRSLYSDVQRILVDVGRAASRAHSMMRGELGRLRIAINESAARNTLIIDRLLEFRRVHPNLALELMPMLTEEQIKSLDRQEVDAGLMYDFEEHADFEVRHLAVDVLVVAMHHDHRLAARPAIQLADLAGEPLILPSRRYGAHLFDRIVTTCRAGGLDPNIAMEVRTADAALSFAAAGLGIGFVSESGREPANIVLRPLENFHVPMHLSLVWRRDVESAALAGFIEVITAQGTAPPSVAQRP